MPTMTDTDNELRAILAVATRRYGRGSAEALAASAEFRTGRLIGTIQRMLAEHPEINQQQRIRIVAAVMAPRE